VSGVTTHVLDLASGRPAAGVAVSLEREAQTGWTRLADAVTDGDGRVREWPRPVESAAGVHRLRFATGAYFAARGVAAFHPEVTVAFAVAAPEEPCHVPLLLSPFGYSTYRGT
jgi:5-hydroxyisourate hydrolase